MNIEVCDRGSATYATFPHKWAVISIICPLEKEVEFLPDPNRVGILRLCFDDVDKLSNQYIAFNMEMAREVWDFIEKHEGIETLLIHRSAGMCRSPGIAAGIDKVLTGDDSKWFKTKTPNSRVYRCITAVKLGRAVHPPKVTREDL